MYLIYNGCTEEKNKTLPSGFDLVTPKIYYSAFYHKHESKVACKKDDFDLWWESSPEEIARIEDNNHSMYCMEIGKLYVVTKQSKDGSYKKGDYVKLLDDDFLYIINVQARGWHVEDEAFETTTGMEIGITREFVMNRVRELDNSIRMLEEKKKELISDIGTVITF